jgi:acetoin utilization protein AcuB
MKASRVMTRQVVCVPPTLTLARAYALLAEHRIRHLPVVEGNLLQGILSDRDLLTYAQRAPDGQLSFPELPVSQVMSRRPITCKPNSKVTDIAALMLENKIDSVPVTDPAGHLRGLVTSTDLLEMLRTPDETYERIPFTYELQDAGGRPLRGDQG